jgi:hypothetical protein
MTPEELAAQEAAAAVNQNEADGADDKKTPAKTVYTPEEINELHPTAIDL